MADFGQDTITVAGNINTHGGYFELFADHIKINDGITIDTSSTLLGGLEDAVHELVHYPYGCIEQTASGLLPIVALGMYPAAFIAVLMLLETAKAVLLRLVAIVFIIIDRFRMSTFYGCLQYGLLILLI